MTDLGPRPDAVDASPRWLRLADGRRLAYGEYGDPTGRPSLHCHGFPSSRLEAALLHAAAVASGTRLISPDRPGYGDSDPERRRTLLSWADDVQALADHLALERLALIGWSGGGPYALACLARIPERISGCALICPLGPIDRDDVRVQMRLATRLSFELAHRSPALSWWLHARPLPTLISIWPGLIDRVRAGNSGQADRRALQDQHVSTVLNQSVQAAMRRGAIGTRQDLALYTHPWQIDFSALDRSIDRPIDLWHGDADNTVPLAHAHWYAAHLPGCRLRIMPGEGHYSLPLNHGAAILQTLQAIQT